LPRDKLVVGERASMFLPNQIGAFAFFLLTGLWRFSESTGDLAVETAFQRPQARGGHSEMG